MIFSAIAFENSTFSRNCSEIQNPRAFVRLVHILVTQYIQYCVCSERLSGCFLNFVTPHLYDRGSREFKAEILGAELHSQLEFSKNPVSANKIGRLLMDT